MIVWVVARVHADNCGGRTTVREHPDEDQVCVVNPVEARVALGFEPSGTEHVDASVAGPQVWIELVVGIFGRMDVCHWRFIRLGVCGYLNDVVEGGPMCALGTQRQIRKTD